MKKDFSRLLWRVTIAIICTLTVFFVKQMLPRALEMTTQSLNNNVTGNDTFDSNAGYFFKNNVNFQNVWTERFTFTTPIDIEGYDYAQFGFVLNYTMSTTSDGYIINDTDAEYYCTNWVQQYQAYADGTTSSYWLCSTWDLRGSGGDDVSEHITITSTETPYIGINIDLVFQNGVVSPCEVNSVNMGNTYITCKIPNTAKTINNIRFRNAGSLRPTTGRFGLQNVITKWKDPMSLINGTLSSGTQQAHQDAQAQLQATQETNSYLKDNTAPNSDISSLGNVSGLLPPGPLDSLLNLPLQFASILLSSFSGTCSPLSFNFVFNETFTFPCFEQVIYNNIPTTLMVFIDTLPAVLIFILYSKHLYKKVERATSLGSTADDEWGVI